MAEHIGDLRAEGRRFAIVAARFNAAVVDRLLEGAIDCFRRSGVEEGQLVVARVPGAFEIPVALEALAASRSYAGLVALGAVIRGETPHFDWVCHACTVGCEAVARGHRVAVGFGLLTCDDTAQAMARAGGRAGNKGEEAAAAVLETSNLLRSLVDRGLAVAGPDVDSKER